MKLILIPFETVSHMKFIWPNWKKHENCFEIWYKTSQIQKQYYFLITVNNNSFYHIFQVIKTNLLKELNLFYSKCFIDHDNKVFLNICSADTWLTYNIMDTISELTTPTAEQRASCFTFTLFLRCLIEPIKYLLPMMHQQWQVNSSDPWGPSALHGFPPLPNWNWKNCDLNLYQTASLRYI